VTEGGNGSCGGDYSSCSGSLSSPLDCGVGALICNASIGYDGPTGVGSPNSVAALKPQPQQVEPKKEPEPEKTKPAKETNGTETKTSTVETNRTETNGSSQSNSLSQTVTSSNSSSSLPSKPKPQGSTAIRISSLKLTPNAIFALDNGATGISALSFAFTISAPAPVSARLSRQIRADGHLRWRGLSRSQTIDALKGANHSRLKTDLRLTAGRYLLTLTPLHGAALSIAFRVL
jgi:hypothetical protein